jgi:hypothetical protein
LAARYRRATVGSNHYDAQPDNSALQTGKIYYFPLCSSPAATASRRRGNDLGTTAKYLRGAAGIGLGTTAKFLRRTTSAAANNGIGTKIKYLVNQNAGAGNNWAKAHIHKS